MKSPVSIGKGAKKNLVKLIIKEEKTSIESNKIDSKNLDLYNELKTEEELNQTINKILYND